MNPVPWQPTLNACLNAGAALLAGAGYLCVRSGRVGAHRLLMQAALAASVLFLVSYVHYHAGRIVTRFDGMGWQRAVYLLVLSTHSLLAVVVAPLVLVTWRLGRRDERERHRRLARWTLPIWLYVSVTGIVVYVMLYHRSGG